MGQKILVTMVAAVAAALLALSLAGLWLIARTPAGQATGAEVTLGPARLVFPAGYARFAGQRGGGAFDRFEIAATFPDFAPAGEVSNPSPALDLAERHDQTIFISLAAKEPGLDPAERPVKLYARFLEQEEWSHPGGLVMRRFLAASPFDGEDLYIAPPEGRLFAARCMRPRSPPDGLPDTCIQDFRIGALDVQMRFSPNLLAQWERLREGARRLVEGMAR